jgi:hypothetical protein
VPAHQTTLPSFVRGVLASPSSAPICCCSPPSLSLLILCPTASLSPIASPQDIRKQLYSEQDERQFQQWLLHEVRSIEGRLEDSRCAIQHLETQLINTACDDPGKWMEGVWRQWPQSSKQGWVRMRVGRGFQGQCATTQINGGSVEAAAREQQTNLLGAYGGGARADEEEQKRVKQAIAHKPSLQLLFLASA